MNYSPDYRTTRRQCCVRLAGWWCRCPRLSSNASHASAALAEFSWASDRTFKLCLLTYKCLHGLAPECCVPLAAVQGRSQLCSAVIQHLLLPRTYTVTLGPRATHPIQRPGTLFTPYGHSAPSSGSWRQFCLSECLDLVTMRAMWRIRQLCVLKCLFTYLLTYLLVRTLDSEFWNLAKTSLARDKSVVKFPWFAENPIGFFQRYE